MSYKIEIQIEDLYTEAKVMELIGSIVELLEVEATKKHINFNINTTKEKSESPKTDKLFNNCLDSIKKINLRDILNYYQSEYIECIDTLTDECEDCTQQLYLIFEIESGDLNRILWENPQYFQGYSPSDYVCVCVPYCVHSFEVVSDEDLLLEIESNLEQTLYWNTEEEDLPESLLVVQLSEELNPLKVISNISEDLSKL